MRKIVIALACVGVLATAACGSDDKSSSAADKTSTKAATSATSSAAAAKGECEYPADSEKASKPVQPPSVNPDASEKTATATIETSQGNIGLTFDSAKAPCTVHSFISLAKQGYYNSTPCHRLTAADSLSVLQCGDPSGTGSGGPGYSFGDEYPIPSDPTATATADYKRGTLAMANAGPDTNGSQFFLVYANSTLPPDYTIFGTIDDEGLQTLDKIAAEGIEAGQRGPSDGKPKAGVEIKAVTIT